MSILLVLFGLFSLSCATLAPLYSNGKIVEGSYIVVYKDEVPADVFAKDVLVAVQQYEVVHHYTTVFKGYAANMNDEQLASVRANPFVKHVELDQIMEASACSTPVSAGSWGLTRISQQTQVNLDGTYTYPVTAGQGVVVYVVDTGIYVAHSDFGGRATFGWKAVSSWSNTDANGHGTHVASTSVGNNYGVARSATTVAVKVLGDNGSGTNSGVIAGVDWALSEAVSKGQKAVINMSLGGGYSSALNLAVNNAVTQGVVTVVAAGNEDSDACDGSPSSATGVLTVGSTEEGVASSPDVRSYFSNYGTCVNVFAPGSAITAAWIGGTNAVNTISGTSMASPHVAGIAALLRAVHPMEPAVAIQQRILTSSTPSVVNLLCTPQDGTACTQTPRSLAWNGC